jgi:hypothetical protein
MPTNLGVDHIKRHKHQLAHFFHEYQVALARTVNRTMPSLAYKVHCDQFDSLGMLWFDKAALDAKSLHLVQKIEDSYMSMSFFSLNKQALGSRGSVYYSSALVDDRLRTVVRLVNHFLQSW